MKFLWSASRRLLLTSPPVAHLVIIHPHADPRTPLLFFLRRVRSFYTKLRQSPVWPITTDVVRHAAGEEAAAAAAASSTTASVDREVRLPQTLTSSY